MKNPCVFTMSSKSTEPVYGLDGKFLVHCQIEVVAGVPDAWEPQVRVTHYVGDKEVRRTVLKGNPKFSGPEPS